MKKLCIKPKQLKECDQTRRLKTLSGLLDIIDYFGGI